MTTATLDKNEILSEIGEAVSGINQLMLSVDEHKINAIPYEGSWTAPQLLIHVTKSINGMANALLAGATPADRDPEERVEQLKTVFLDFSHKLQSPAFIVPEAGTYERQPTIDQLNEAFHQFKTNAAGANVNDLVEGLPLGPVTKSEIIYFVLFHTQRHLHQMKKISTALGSE